MLDERGVDRCVVGGISLGGYVAMALLRARPGVVAGLLLCDTKATADADAARENRERLALRCLAAPGETVQILEEAVLPGLLGETTRANRPEVVKRVRGWLAAAEAGPVAWYQRAMAARPDSRAALAAADVPVLVVWGEEDALSPRAEQDLMVAAASGADLVVVEGSGHLANVEDPPAVTAAMLGLLEAVRGPRSS
jgi:pimeloyl-ACP methyl ester carboxylesterase